MSIKDNHITQLFKKYLKGDISRIEQRALDKEVQENPYAQDAKEGLDQISSVNKEESFTNLESRLKSRIQKENPRKGIAWLSAAAGIAILVASALLVWQTFGNNKSISEATSNIVTNSEQNEIYPESQSIGGEEFDDRDIDFDITVFNQGSVSVDEVHIEDFATEEQKEKINNSTSYTDVKQKRIEIPQSSSRTDYKQSESANTYYVDGVQVEGNLIPVAEKSTPSPKQASPDLIAAQENIAKSKLENNKELKKDITESENSATIGETDGFATDEIASPAASPTRKSKIANAPSNNVSELKTIKGVVKDEKGESLIGATVYDLQNNIGTVTDINGTFTLNVPVKVNELNISYTGYENLTIGIPENNEVIASIVQGASLSEVVVTDLGASKKESRSNVFAIPVDGNSAFKKYIKSNLVYPTEAKEANIKGKVVLLFNISSDGSPIDIEVKKSLGYGCDQEAIRLLREGPKWIPGNSNEKSSISIRFRGL